MSEIDLIREILRYDIDPEFLRTAAIMLAWEYDQLYDQIGKDHAIPPEYKLEEFAKRKSACATRVLVRAALQHGIPFNFRKLPCNGQRKLLLKIGRVILIQETFCGPRDEPKASSYKCELADTHGLIRQLELDLGDQPHRILDWSGNVLAVFLHGSSGPAFTQRDRKLGGLMLAVPDAGYVSWVVRLDLTRLAIEGAGTEAAAEDTQEQPPAIQQDHVGVSLRRKAEDTGTEE